MEESDKPHYDSLSAASVGTAATMLTLIATIGTSHPFPKDLVVAELLFLVFTIVTGVFSLLIRIDNELKRYTAIITALGLIGGVVLLTYLSVSALIG